MGRTGMQAGICTAACAHPQVLGRPAFLAGVLATFYMAAVLMQWQREWERARSGRQRARGS